MKKLLLLGLVSCMSLLGFTSANYTFVSNTNDNALYSPNNITLTESFDFYNNVLNYNCENTSCQIIISDNDYVQMCDISYNSSDGIFSESNNCIFSAGNYIVFGTMEDQIFSSISFGVNNEGGAEGGNNGGGILLPGGESDLSGIITGLNSTINEFIPYLVYLGLGIITVIIGFVAIRWLVNRTQAKVRGTFSSGRRRR